jgi:hypothetical protein
MDGKGEPMNVSVLGAALRDRVRIFALGVVTAVATCCLTGCETVPLGHTYQRVVSLPAGHAVVYLFRPSLPYEYGVVFTVEADGASVVGLADGSYYPYVVKRGTVVFTSERAGEKVSRLEMLLESGKSYYVQLVPVRGLFRFRPELTQLHEQSAEVTITGCRLVLK